jgi:fumarate reductase flavoprotein subunit
VYNKYVIEIRIRLNLFFYVKNKDFLLRKNQYGRNGKMKAMKKIAAIGLSLLMGLSVAGCGAQNTAQSAPQDNKAQVFVGEAQGHNGPIKLEVTIEGEEMKAIDVIEHKESDFTNSAIEQVTKAMITSNSVEVDTVAGATVTSNALIEAVKTAVATSGITLAAKGQDAVAAVAEVEDVTTDVVIIGAGGAGLTSAIEATLAGVNVIVVEKNSFMGGNTNYATGGMNAAATKNQAAQGVEDSIELFYEDTMAGGKDKNDPELLKVFTESSSDAIDWLEELGADLSKISRSGGQSVDRTHTTKDGSAVGAHLMSVFEDNIQKLEIDVRLSTKAVEILSEDNKVTGIVVENVDGSQYTIHAKAVIVASGGFGASQEMVTRFNPEYAGFGTTNNQGATGDAITMVEKLDVALVNPEYIQTHPTVVAGGSTMITEGTRGEGAILVNREGKRFINELETRDTVSKAILEQEGETAFLIFDENVPERLAAVRKYKESGLLTEADSLTDLADKLGINGEELENTVATYNTYFANQQDAEFERRVIAGELVKAPFYAVEVAPAIHHTMGGLKINTSAQVINNQGEVVEGLFAAGEVTGGIHGANRVGGNAVTDIVVFGRIAGESAAAFIQ